MNELLKQHYLNALKSKYRNFAFKRIFIDQVESYTIEYYYQPLFIVNEKHSYIANTSSAWGLNNIFISTHQADEKELLTINGVEKKRILVEGEPGIGKSTWCEHIAQSWAAGRIGSDFPWILKIPLRDFQSRINFLLKENKSQITEIQAWCLVWGIDESDDDYTVKLNDLKLLKKYLEDSNIPVLYLLDGWDELSHGEQNNPINKLLDKLLSKPYVILTTRPMVINFTKDKYLRIHGFANAERDKFITGYYNSLPLNPKEIENLINGFKQLLNNKSTRNSLIELSRSPTLLEMLCWLYQKDEKRSFLLSHVLQYTEIYKQCIYERQCLWLRRDKKIENVETLPKFKIEEHAEPLMKFLELMAYNAWKNKNIILPATLVQELYEKYYKTFEEKNINHEDLFTHFGLLRSQAQDYNKKKLERNWLFVHYSFQEYFVARYLLRLIKKAKAKEENFTSLVALNQRLSFEQRNRLLSRESRVLPFLCGLLSREQRFDTNFLREFTEQLEDLNKLNQDKVTAFVYCLMELPFNKLNEYYIHSILPTGNFFNEIWFTICRLGLLQLAESILSKDREIANKQSSLQYSSLHFACESGNKDFISLLIKYLPNTSVNRSNCDGRTPLHVAANFSFIEVVETLIKNGANLNAIDNFGETPFLIALREGQFEVAKYLQKYGASMEVINILGESPYLLIKQKGWQEEFKLTEEELILQLKGVDSKLSVDQRLLRTVCVDADLEAADKSLNLQNINLIFGKKQDNLLISTVFRGHLEMAKLLIKKNINVRHRLTNGRTALYFTARKGHVEIAKLLLETAPDLLDQKDDSGTDAMWIAREFGQREIITLFEEARKKDNAVLLNTPFEDKLKKDKVDYGNPCSLDNISNYAADVSNNYNQLLHVSSLKSIEENFLMKDKTIRALFKEYVKKEFVPLIQAVPQPMKVYILAYEGDDDSQQHRARTLLKDLRQLLGDDNVLCDAYGMKRFDRVSYYAQQLPTCNLILVLATKKLITAYHYKTSEASNAVIDLAFTYLKSADKKAVCYYLENSKEKTQIDKLFPPFLQNFKHYALCDEVSYSKEICTLLHDLWPANATLNKATKACKKAIDNLLKSAHPSSKTKDSPPSSIDIYSYEKLDENVIDLKDAVKVDLFNDNLISDKSPQASGMDSEESAIGLKFNTIPVEVDNQVQQVHNSMTSLITPRNKSTTFVVNPDPKEAMSFQDFSSLRYSKEIIKLPSLVPVQSKSSLEEQEMPIIKKENYQAILALCEQAEIVQAAIRGTDAKEAFIELIKNIQTNALEIISIIERLPASEDDYASRNKEVIIGIIQSNLDTMKSRIEKEIEAVSRGDKPYLSYQDRDVILRLIESIHLKYITSEEVTITKVASHEKGQALRIEQELLHKRFSSAFNKLLGDIKAITWKHYQDYFLPKIFVSYVSPSRNHAHERWTQAFVINLANDLAHTGIIVSIEPNGDSYGQHGEYVRRNIQDSDYILVIGIESLKEKYESVASIDMEIRLINDRCKEILEKAVYFSGGHNPIVALVLSGSFEKVFPANLQSSLMMGKFPGKSMPNFAQTSYLTNLKALLFHLFRASSEDVRLNEAWEEFERKNPQLKILAKGLPDKAVQQYLKGEQIQLDEEAKNFEEASMEMLTDFLKEKSTASPWLSKNAEPISKSQNKVSEDKQVSSFGKPLQIEFVYAMAVQGVNIPTKNKLHQACYELDKDGVLECIKVSNSSWYNDNGNTPFHLLACASKKNSVDQQSIVASLITLKLGDALKVNNKGVSALQLAIFNNQDELIKNILGDAYTKYVSPINKLCLRLKFIDNLNIEEFMDKCINGYKEPISDENRSKNQKLLKEAVCDLLNIQEIKYEVFHYLALLRSKAGAITEKSKAFEEELDRQTGKTLVFQTMDNVEGYKLEGWNAGAFLATRIYFFLWILVDLEKENVKDIEKSDKTIAKEKLRTELYLAIHAFNFYLIRETLKALEEPYRNEFKQAYIRKLMQRVGLLNPLEEIYCPAGHQEHIIYINFQRISNLILIRIDNLEEGCERYEHPKVQVQVNKKEGIITKEKFRPRLIAVVPINHFLELNTNCQTYFNRIFDVANAKNVSEFATLYEYPHFKGGEAEEITCNWPARSLQKVGNCVVKNHNVGLMYRFFKNRNEVDNSTNRILYKWIRTQEQQHLVEKIDPERKLQLFG